MGPPPKKINLISYGPMVHVSDIKLIRTNTTLDLSQKAEKGMIFLYTYIKSLLKQTNQPTAAFFLCFNQSKKQYDVLSLLVYFTGSGYEEDDWFG
ncbi:hypothetical protein ACOSQ3_020857 [Xanthoceras sorbifolium]